MNRNRPRAIRRTALVCLLVASAAVVLAEQAKPSLSVEAAATQPAPKAKPAPPPPVPEKLLAEFIRAAKASPEYRLVKSFPPDKVRKAAETWQKELGVRLRIDSSSGWEWAGDKDIRLADGTTGHIKWHEIGYTGERWLALELRAKGKTATYYSLSQPRLAKLATDWNLRVVIVDPANQPLLRFSAAAEDFAGVVTKLCKAGDLSVALRQDLAGKIRLTLDLRDRSAVDCLQVACRAAGWTVGYHTRRGRLTRRVRLATEPPNPHVFLSSLHKPPAETTMEDLRKAVAEAARKVLKSRPIAILEPAAAPKPAGK